MIGYVQGISVVLYMLEIVSHMIIIHTRHHVTFGIFHYRLLSLLFMRFIHGMDHVTYGNCA